MAEELVTVFKLETAEFDKKLADATKGMEGYDKTTDEATKANGALGNSLGSVSGKAQTYRTVMQAAAKSTGDVAKETAKVAQSTGLIGKLSGAWNSVKTGVTNAGAGIKSFFGGIVDGVASSVPGLSSVAGGFGGMLGPIGLAATAVVGFISNFARLDSVGVELDALRIQFDIILDRLTSFKGFVGLFDPATQQRDAQFAKAQAILLDELDDKRREATVTIAENNKAIAANEQRLRDATRTEAERLKIADELNAKELENARLEESVIEGNIKAIQREIALKKLNGIAENDLSDEIKDRLANEQVALANAQAATISAVERTQRRVNSITEQGANERKALADKEEADAQKAAQAREARLKREASLRQELDRARASRVATTPEQQEVQQAVQTRDDRVARAEGNAALIEQIEEDLQASLQAIRDKYASQQVAAQDAQNARILKSKSDLAAKELEELAKVQVEELMLAAMRGQDITALQVEQAEERAGLIATIRDAELQTKLEQFDAEYAAAEKQGLDTITLTEQQEAELAAIRLRYREEDLASYTDTLARKYEADQQAQQAEAEINNARAGALQGVGVLVETLAAKQSAAAQAALVAQKAAAIAAIIINTQTAIVGALAGAASNPIIAAGGPAAIAAAAAPTIILAKVNAALGIATILAQSIKGAYTGERNIGGDGERPIWSGKDGYLRRVHRGEDIIAADKAKKYRPVLDAIHDDRLDQVMPKYQSLFVGQGRAELRTLEYVTSLGAVNQYVEGSHITNHYSTASGSVPEFDDGRIVGALSGSTKEQRKQTALLQQLSAKQRGQNKRYR